MRPFIDKDYSWKQCSTRENRSVHNFLLFHWRRHVKKLGFVLHQVPNACWWSKKPEFLTYYVKHSSLLFWTLSCCILRVGILDLLTFFCWYRGTDCEQKKQYNQTINPLHYRVDVTYESIWYPERLKSLSHWGWYVEMLLVKNKQVVSSQGLLKSLIFHKDIETPNVAHLLCIWKVMTLKVNFKDLLLRSEAWKYHSKRPEKGRKVKMVRWMMTFHLRNRGYYMALRRH